MFKTILVDDERPALTILARLLKEYPTIEVVGEYTNFGDALAKINSADIQLVFLDIHMPKANGLEAAKKITQINQNIDIIFVTAYNQFALDAFEINTLDYIMKPVTKKRLDKTIERITNKHAVPDIMIVRQQRNEFLNDLVAGKITEPTNLIHQAKLLGIDFSRSCTFF